MELCRCRIQIQRYDQLALADSWAGCIRFETWQLVGESYLRSNREHSILSFLDFVDQLV